MKTNNGNKFNKYFLYVLLCVFIFTVVLVLTFFIAGNTDVFKWDSFTRFVIILITLAITIVIIGCKKPM